MKYKYCELAIKFYKKCREKGIDSILGTNPVTGISNRLQAETIAENDRELQWQFGNTLDVTAVYTLGEVLAEDGNNSEDILKSFNQTEAEKYALAWMGKRGISSFCSGKTVVKTTESEEEKLAADFYKSCDWKKINPLSGEADFRRANLLADNNEALKKKFGDKPDVIELYRLGKERAEAKKSAEEQAEKEKEREKHRSVDEAFADMEQELADQVNREKLLYLYQKARSNIEARIPYLDHAIENAANSYVAMNQLQMEKESDYGTLGGIAAGVTGSTAFGAAVAADAMQKNAGIRERNEQIKKENIKMLIAQKDSIYKRKSSQQSLVSRLRGREENGVKLLLTEEYPEEKLMEELTFSELEIYFTEGDTMQIRVTVTPTVPYTIAGSAAAVVDGSFLAEIYEGKELVGSAVLNLPVNGLEGASTIFGHCLEAEPGAEYTVCIIPNHLWLIEKHDETEILPDHIMAGYYRPTAEDLYRSWQTISQTKEVTWQQRREALNQKAEEERAEAERKRIKAEQKRIEIARKKAEQKARNKKRIVICAAAVLVSVVGLFAYPTVIQPLMKYQKAESLLAEGKYDDAYTAFEEIKGYKDVDDEFLKEVAYEKVKSLLAEGKYGDAYAALEQIEGYEDMDIEALIEVVYQRAKSLLAEGEYDDAYAALEQIRGYKDADALLMQNEELPKLYEDDGNTITFGHYEQDNNTDNGPEPIWWTVLARDGEKAFLLSNMALDAQPYHAEKVGITWENSTIRSWLNETFLNEAFTAEEQAAILVTTVDNSPRQGISGFDTEGGNNTQDKLFLMSYKELTDYSSEMDAELKWTEYAGRGFEYEAGWWWLRSPAASQDLAMAVYTQNGQLGSGIVDTVHAFVRPALWLNLDEVQ